ncbi:MAG TPA: hypothetical protein VK530_09865 [Candidatus Acidoferrum sp.]|nr:hypothetical protein [Candidatus Acidoferrum sp.]
MEFVARIPAGGNCQRLFQNPDDASVRDLVGLVISFPESKQPQRVEAYLEGSVGWRPIE